MDNIYHKHKKSVLAIPDCSVVWDFARVDVDRGFPAETPHSDNVFHLKPSNLLYDYWESPVSVSCRDIPIIKTGPFGHALFFDAESQFTNGDNQRTYLTLDRESFHDSPIDCKGDQSFTFVVWVVKHISASNHFIAGIWHEGTDLDDCRVVEAGKRQYAIFGGLRANPGGVAGHVSDTGGGTFGDTYARHLAVTEEKIAEYDFSDMLGKKPQNSETISAKLQSGRTSYENAWQCLAMQYDAEEKTVTAYLQGRAKDHWVERPNDNPFYSHHLASFHQERDSFPACYTPPVKFVVSYKGKITRLKVNPYWFGQRIYSPGEVPSGGPFTVGRAVSSFRNAGFTGLIGGVALFSRCLTQDELQQLSTREFLRSTL